jgi:hypothetical protein
MRPGAPDPDRGDGHALVALLVSLQPGPEEDRVTVAELLHRVGERSFASVLLAVGLMLVSPLSAIPGSPSVGMAIVVMVAAQAALGRRHLWLPGVLMRRSLPASALARALDWLAPAVRWIDGHSRDRLRLLTVPPVDRLLYLAIIVTALPWPLLEPLPMMTSVGALAVSLFAVALMLRDGAWAVAGLAVLGVLAALVTAVLRSVA